MSSQPILDRAHVRPMGATELVISNVVEKRGQLDDQLVGALLTGQPQREGAHPLDMPPIVAAAIARGLLANVVLRPANQIRRSSVSYSDHRPESRRSASEPTGQPLPPPLAGGESEVAGWPDASLNRTVDPVVAHQIAIVGANMGSQFKKAHKLHALAQPAGVPYPEKAATAIDRAGTDEASRLFADLCVRVPDAGERAGLLGVTLELDASWRAGRRMPLLRARRQLLLEAIRAAASATGGLSARDRPS
jgi:hypothetical protein